MFPKKVFTFGVLLLDAFKLNFDSLFFLVQSQLRLLANRSMISEKKKSFFFYETGEPEKTIELDKKNKQENKLYSVDCRC
jgi:hypothetical protein